MIRQQNHKMFFCFCSIHPCKCFFFFEKHEYAIFTSNSNTVEFVTFSFNLIMLIKTDVNRYRWVYEWQKHGTNFFCFSELCSRIACVCVKLSISLHVNIHKFPMNSLATIPVRILDGQRKWSLSGAMHNIWYSKLCCVSLSIQNEAMSKQERERN